MTRVLTVLFLLFYINSVTALEASFEVCSYVDVQTKNAYIDTYIRILGQTIDFQSTGNGRQAAVNVTITIEQGKEIITFDKYVLNSPLVTEASDFIDMKRFALKPGVYAVHLVASDAKDPTNQLELKKFVTVSGLPDGPSLSDVMLLGKAAAAANTTENPLVKHGVEMEPLTYGYANEEKAVLPLFVELYNILEPCYISYGVYEGYVVEGAPQILAKFKKVDPSEITPLVLQLPIDKVRSGAYHVRVELYNLNKELLSSSKSDFVRRNPSYDKQYWTDFNEVAENSFVDSIPTEKLRYNLIALVPVVKEPFQTTLQTVLDLENERAQRHFLFDYWKSQSSQFPHVAYRQYMKVADLVHEEYDNNVGFGFQTDRGHLFLKYGKPNNIIAIDNEPDAFPYEIWYYGQLDVVRQTQVRFIFYNPSLSHNDYQLLHSTCIGERNNPAWEVELYKRAPNAQIGATIEATEIKDGWNRRAKEYFNDF